MIGPTVAIIQPHSCCTYELVVIRYVICMEKLSSRLALQMKMATRKEIPKMYCVNCVICLGYTNLLKNN